MKRHGRSTAVYDGDDDRYVFGVKKFGSVIEAIFYAERLAEQTGGEFVTELVEM